MSNDHKLPELPEGFRFRIVRSGVRSYPLRIYLQKKILGIWWNKSNQISMPNQWDVSRSAAELYREWVSVNEGSLNNYLGNYPPKEL